MVSFQERSSFLEYQKIVRSTEYLSRLCIAYQFFLAEKTKTSATEVLREMQSNLVKLCESMAEGEKKLKEGDEEIAEMEKKRDKASENRVLLLII